MAQNPELRGAAQLLAELEAAAAPAYPTVPAAADSPGAPVKPAPGENSEASAPAVGDAPQ